MKITYLILLPLLYILACTGQGKTSSASSTFAPESKARTQILMLGTLHFSQFQKKDVPSQNFFGEKRQAEIAEVNKLLQQFKPGMVMVEVSPEHQAELDSLYNLYLSGELDLAELENGSSEIYQIGFKTAKALKQKQLFCINYDQSTSQGLLASGDNFELYEEGFDNFRKTTRGVTAEFVTGNSTFRELLYTLNKPEIIEFTHHQIYNLPAYVQNGSFRSYEGLNKSEVDTTQIGAEFISLFYERNLKIYSNILNSQLRSKGQRILLIMGQTHIGVLQDILDNNPAYEIVSANKYLGSSI